MKDKSAAQLPPSQRSVVDHVVDGLSAILTLIGLAWALDLPERLGFLFYTEQLVAVLLGLALAIVFLRTAAGARQSRVGVFLSVAAAVIFAAICFYLAARYQNFLFSMVQSPQVPIAIGACLISAVILATRKVAGLFLAGLLVAFLLLALFGDLLPAAIQGRSISWQRLLAYLAIDPTAMLGLPLVVSCTIVLAFIFFGMLIVAFGGSDFFTRLSLLTVGRFRGGAAKVAVVGSGLFGSVSGSAVANVVATGVITVPLMRRAGYKGQTAGAIEAVASTGGQLLPPIMGAAAFLMAEFLQISYGEVLIAALVPALLYYLAVFIYTDLVAARDAIESTQHEAQAEEKSLLGQGWPFVLPFVALLVALFTFNQRPEISALIAAGALVLSCMISRPREILTYPRLLLNALVSTGGAVVEIIVIAAAAGIIIGILNLSGTGFALSLVLLKLGAGNLGFVLVITAIVSIILGMGMPTVGVYVLLAALAAPALVELGVPPIAAHLFVLYFGLMSMITPPVAIASYAAAAIAGSRPMETAIESVKVGWTAFIIPFMFAVSPSLLMIGSPIEIAVSVATASAGVWFVTAAVVGYGTRTLGSGMRAAHAIVGLVLLVPIDAFGRAGIATALGVAAALALLFFERMRRRRHSEQPQP